MADPMDSHYKGDNHYNISNDTSSMNGHGNVTPVFDRWATEHNKSAIIVPIIFGIIFVIGIVGNGTLIVSVLANKVMRNVPNILIVCLAFGDFLLILVSVPMASTFYTFMSWPYGTLGCKLHESLQTVSLSVTIITLTALSADRYLAIVDPLAKLAGRTRKTTVAIAVGIWVISLVFALPDAILSEANEIDLENETFVSCTPYPSRSYAKVYNVVRLFLFFIFPVLAIGFFYLMMARTLIQSHVSIPTETKTEAANYQRQVNARRKVARVVLSFVIIFIVCWLPTHIYRMWYFFDSNDFNAFWIGFKTTAFCLQFINSCINPFALYFLSAQFRKYYNRYLFCCCQTRKYRNLDQTSTMHHLNGRHRRGSATNTSMIPSQSMC